MAKSKRTGRIPKLTPEVQAAVVRDIAAGVPHEHAAEHAGVHRAILFRWLARGRKDRSGPYRDFCDAVKKAEAGAVAASVARVRRAAQGGQVVERTTTTTTRKDGSSTTKVVEKLSRGEWTADAWFLERRHPDEFAGNRTEVRELRDQLAAVLRAVKSGQLAGRGRRPGRRRLTPTPTPTSTCTAGSPRRSTAAPLSS